MAAEPSDAVVTEEDRQRKQALDHLEALYWGGVITWAGVVFWIDSLGYLPQVDRAGAWSWIFLGAGLYALFQARFRLRSPEYPNPTTVDYVWAGAWTLLGLEGFPGFDIAWPLVLVAVGAAVLGRALRQGPPHVGPAPAGKTRVQGE